MVFKPTDKPKTTRKERADKDMKSLYLNNEVTRIHSKTKNIEW